MIICDRCKRELTDGKYERLPYDDRTVLCESCYDEWISFEIDGLAELGRKFLTNYRRDEEE